MNRTLDKLFAQGGRAQTDTKTRWMSRRITEREYQDFRRHLAYLPQHHDNCVAQAGALMLESIKDRPRI